MSEHLDKAKAALADASSLVGGDDVFDPSNLGLRSRVNGLLDIAVTQAAVAQAEAMESIARSLETLSHPLVTDRIGSSA